MKTLLNIGAIVLLIIGIVSWVILIGKGIIERYKKIKNES
jgi:hypothetical protein